MEFLKEVQTMRVLDQLDEWRRKHQNDPDYDFAMRTACAIIAKEAGFSDRNGWCNILKEDETTAYSRDIKERG